MKNQYGETRVVHVVKGTRILQTDDGDTKRATITARSERHANRLMKEHGMYGWESRGPGTTYCDVWFNARRKRIEIVQSWDC